MTAGRRYGLLFCYFQDMIWRSRWNVLENVPLQVTFTNNIKIQELKSTEMVIQCKCWLFLMCLCISEGGLHSKSTTCGTSGLCGPRNSSLPAVLAYEKFLPGICLSAIVPHNHYLVAGIGSDQQHQLRQICFPVEKHCCVAAQLHKLLLETLRHCGGWTSCFVAVL